MLVRYSSRLMGMLALLALMAAGAGCAMRPSRTVKIEPDWSRGEHVGVAGWNQPGGIVAEPDGSAVHLAWISRDQDRLGLSYARLDREGKTVVTRPLDGDLVLPRELRLLRTGSGKLLLLTRASPGSDTAPGINLLVLDADGRAAGPLQLLSREGAAVQAYAAAPTLDGGALVVLATTEADGGRLEYLRLDADGRLLEPPLQITSGASDPALAVDAAGTVHLIWLKLFPGQRYEMYYARFPAADARPTAGTMVTTYAGSTGTSFEQPAIGLDTGHVYVFWSRVEKAGVEAGTGQTFYIAFPPGQPVFLEAARLEIPPDGKPQHRPYVGSYKIQSLAPMPGAGFIGTDTLRMPAPVAGQRADLAVAFSANMEFGRSSQVVPILVFFRDGAVAGYQVLARTDQLAIFPVVCADTGQVLHAVFLASSSEGYDVYYASTAAPVKATLDVKDSTDYAVSVRDTVSGMLGGLTLFAMLPLIYFPALLVLIAYALFGGNERLDERTPKIVMLVAITLYLVAKIVVWYGVLINPPLRGVVPTWMDPLLTLAVPVAILALAAAATRAVLRSRHNLSLYVAAGLFCALDSVLSMLLYGPGSFGG